MQAGEQRFLKLREQFYLKLSDLLTKFQDRHENPSRAKKKTPNPFKGSSPRFNSVEESPELQDTYAFGAKLILEKPTTSYSPLEKTCRKRLSRENTGLFFVTRGESNISSFKGCVSFELGER